MGGISDESWPTDGTLLAARLLISPQLVTHPQQICHLLVFAVCLFFRQREFNPGGVDQHRIAMLSRQSLNRKGFKRADNDLQDFLAPVSSEGGSC